MIKNERQYRITKAQAEKFADALANISSRENADPVLSSLEQNALQSQLDELNLQLIEYEKLQSAAPGVISVDSFDELPAALVKARIATGLSQKDLADRLGLKEQQVQRYEATEYRSASLSRLQDVVKALGIHVRKELFLPYQTTSVPFLFDRLSAVGVDREFALHRLLPPELSSRLTCSDPLPSETEIRHAASSIGRVFDWDIDEIFGDEPLALSSEAASLARFKLTSRGSNKKLSAYTVYAHHVALLVLEATPTCRPQVIPTDPGEFREAVLQEFGSISFEHVLAFAWDLGIPILPLCDSGTFHGACWRVDYRNVNVLKQRTMSLARWTHDALHEIYHASQEPELQERSLIEEPETSVERRESEEELEANMFAGDVMLDGRADELARMCVDLANGEVRRLKLAVSRIAVDEAVDVGALSNYMAYRLSLQGIDWWGTASNLQPSGANPWEIARDWLVSKLDLNRLNFADRQILLQALTAG